MLVLLVEIIAIVNNSMAEMIHTSIIAIIPGGYCPLTVTGGSTLNMAFIYSINRDSNTLLDLGSHEVCIDTTSHASGIETGSSMFLLSLFHCSASLLVLSNFPL